MKKRLRFFVMIVCILVLTGCKASGEPGSGGEAPVNKLYGLEVWSFAENDLHAYHLRWPHDYYAFSKEDGGKCMLLDLENAKERSQVTPEEYTYFVEYVNSLPKENRQEDSVPVYRIILNYYDENGEKQYKGIIGYDTFPEGWEEFVQKCNKISGGEYLATGESVQQVTPEFLTEVFGVTDDDVRDGTLQDVINTQQLDMFDVTNPFKMSDKLNVYYVSTKETQIAPFRPFELQEKESTEEEYNAFIKAYLEAPGMEGYAETESDQDYLRYFRDEEAGRYFYIGRSADLKHMQVEEAVAGKDVCRIVLDAHIEDMTFSMNFVYSQDKKFVLLYDGNDVDTILTFVGISNGSSK